MFLNIVGFLECVGENRLRNGVETKKLEAFKIRVIIKGNPHFWEQNESEIEGRQ